MAPSGGRLGLGHDSSADVFDEFRKRSSYNFIKEVSRRDTSAGPKCYNCGKVNQEMVDVMRLSIDSSILLSMAILQRAVKPTLVNLELE